MCMYDQHLDPWQCSRDAQYTERKVFVNSRGSPCKIISIIKTRWNTLKNPLHPNNCKNCAKCLTNQHLVPCVGTIKVSLEFAREKKLSWNWFRCGTPAQKIVICKNENGMIRFNFSISRAATKGGQNKKFPAQEDVARGQVVCFTTAKTTFHCKTRLQQRKNIHKLGSQAHYHRWFFAWHFTPQNTKKNDCWTKGTRIRNSTWSEVYYGSKFFCSASFLHVCYDIFPGTFCNIFYSFPTQKICY